MAKMMMNQLEQIEPAYESMKSFESWLLFLTPLSIRKQNNPVDIEICLSKNLRC